MKGMTDATFILRALHGDNSTSRCAFKVDSQVMQPQTSCRCQNLQENWIVNTEKRYTNDEKDNKTRADYCNPYPVSHKDIHLSH